MSETVTQDYFDTMNSNGIDTNRNKEKIRKWIESDDIAKEIRNIVKRVVVEYHRFTQFGMDIGIVTDDQRRTYINNVRVALHELEEFDVTRDMHVGRQPEDFYQNPRMMAEWVGGDVLKFLKYYGLSDIELDKEISDSGGLQSWDLDDMTVVMLDGKPNKIMEDHIQITSLINNAKRYLGISDREIIIADAQEDY